MECKHTWRVEGGKEGFSERERERERYVSSSAKGGDGGEGRKRSLQTIISNVVASKQSGRRKTCESLKRAEKTMNEKIPKMYKSFAAEHVLSAARGNY